MQGGSPPALEQESALAVKHAELHPFFDRREMLDAMIAMASD
jgi:hypothetical protein